MTPKLGNYTILEEIGRGGMATVYRARQESLNRDVALKELDLSRFKAEPSALDRFRLEARAAAALEHPNIVTIYDLWEEDGKAYIAMEYVDGVELKDVLLTIGSIHFTGAVLIAMAVSEALQYAHLKGMIHRDVKPGNIMLSDSGNIKLMDFGIVSVSGAVDLTVTGQILGTPAYMSPEQISGGELGPGADLFSLGAVLYEMIAGRKPFSGPNHVALIQDVLHGQPVPLQAMDPQVPDSISRAVLKCLEKDPEKRFGSMEEFSTVLEMVMPLERPNRSALVAGLVKSAREQEKTRLHSSTGEDDRTAPLPPVPRTPGRGSDVREHDDGAGGAGPGTPLSEQFQAPVYNLELDPPAELPPLEEVDEAAGSRATKGDTRQDKPSPLALKDIPELDPEQDERRYIEETGKARPRRTRLWVIPVIGLLIAAALWIFAGGMNPSDLVQKTVDPVLKAQITVTVDPSGTVLMDGEPLGDADPFLSAVIKPGLHTLEVRAPGFGARKFIVELEAGEVKEIEVNFRE